MSRLYAQAYLRQSTYPPRCDRTRRQAPAL